MKKSLLIITAVIVTIAALSLSAMDTMQEGGLMVGDVASDFDLKNVDGKMVSMKADNNAKGYILVFTCNTCPYAKLYEDRVIQLDKKYRAKGFPLIAINPNDITKQPDDSMEQMMVRSKEKGYTFPYLRDDSQEVAKAYGASKTPHVYVINKESDGTLRIEFIGAIDDSPREAADVQERYVEAAVDALLAGQKPAITSKRAIGCTIKWKDV